MTTDIGPRGPVPAETPSAPMTDQPGPVAAGDFSSWIDEMNDALRGGYPSDVPCGDCTACCRSSQFIHIGPEESDTLARIPPALLFAAPGLPPGHVLLGYDERGHCPMLVDGRCSIYDHRPRTCQTYDCRIFSATGLADDHDEILIARQGRRWRFSFSSERGRTQQAALGAAARFIRDNPGALPAGAVPTSTTQLAVLAFVVHQCFIQTDEETGQETVSHPEPHLVRTEVLRRTRTRIAG
jgi:uncharacterized protein